jgi:hypothetical protein
VSEADKALAEIEAAMRDMEAFSKPARGSSKAGVATKPVPPPKQERLPSDRPSRRKPARVQPEVVKERKATRAKGPIHQRLITFLVASIAVVVLPFYVLLRGSVYLNQAFAVWPWLAIAGGVGATVVILMLYVAWTRWRIGSGFKFSRGVTRGLIVLVTLYVGYTAMYISAANVKTEEVRETYTSLNPLLRMATSTWVLLDNDVVITDGERQPEDYEKMGLPLNEGSLHYRQETTGYAHAVDLRTKGREEWKNFLMTIYFKIAGFRTLRHTGTADHLHVSLPL